MIADVMGKISTKNEEMQSLLIEPARRGDIAELIELLKMKHPTAWLKKLSNNGIKKFLEYSIDNPRSLILVARSNGDKAAGYILSTLDTRRYWSGFALKYPFTMLAIMAHRFRRINDINKQRKNLAPEDVKDGHLPEFSWSPSGPGIARIIGILVRKEHRGKKVATMLYLGMFDALRKRNCFLVEEYMGPDYNQFVGKYHDCGWQHQLVRGGGYKLAKQL